jgi:Fe-S oxidoreductase/FAD/FMN-containing dehydrogenase
MRDNVLAIEALLADGTRLRMDDGHVAGRNVEGDDRGLFRDLLQLGAREADEIERRFPKVQRRVGGYNLDALTPAAAPQNLAHILVGSEGTLAFSTRIELRLWPVIRSKVMGICHFGSFYRAMDAAQHLVKLEPIAIELVDRTMIGLARNIGIYQPTVDAVVRGDPAALLIVEFAEDDAENRRRLDALAELMADLGFGFDRPGERFGGVVEVTQPKLQAAVTEVRKGGLNIMMSMRSAGKPVSFVEDCAVPLAHLADYTERLTAIFEKHGTRGTWYAHASVGCLHVRPILNLKLEKDVVAMRAIAEEAFAMVRDYKGSHSGEHGDGISRSEFHGAMFGERLVRAFGEVKRRFDPEGLLNPGRVVDPPKMDDRRLFRYPPDYRAADLRPALDWTAWPGGAHGFQGAVEMCNNNGACRKLDGGVMCPSYRATRDERDVTRGRANTLRLALSGQLGEAALTSDAMAETMSLCVSCKACRRECPTGVDMARMKIEVQAARAAEHGHTLRDRLIGYLPRYAPYAAKLAWLLNLRNRLPPLAWAGERLAGLSARRALPRWHFSPLATLPESHGSGPAVALFADSFNRYFEPDNLVAAHRVLTAAGYRVRLPEPAAGSRRPLCCGRTFLSVGMVEEARAEARRLLEALLPLARTGMPIVGLEPSCLLTLRDELPVLLPGEEAALLGSQALLLEEFLARESEAGRLDLDLKPVAARALLHGHCHQKAFGALGAVETVLGLVPELEVETIRSSCCGMAGAFGYQAETYDVSMQMAELSLLPAVRAADAHALILADGTSCRHQIANGTGRQALHVARLLAQALDHPPSQ